ncbi:hypothetical protein evm_006066 [Chilo suppressalis]|nr:hypothetical protein evm_006066 [Chilo suppressalis]
MSFYLKSKKRFSVLNLLKSLEDPEYPSIGPHLRLLGFTGIWHPELTSKTARFKQWLFYLTISFFFSQYIKCFVQFKASSLVLILQYAPFHMGIVKACFFQRNYKKWEKIIHYVSNTEKNQITESNEEITKIITNYIQHSRHVTYFFWALAFFSNFSIFSEPYQKNINSDNGDPVFKKIFDGYIPYSDYPPGYYISMFIQTVLGHIVSAYVVGWDTLICTIMIFFAGQLKVARLLCSRVINVQNPELCRKYIADCHRFHTTLVKNQKLFENLISPAMFVYLIVISVNLGVCIIEIAKIKNDTPTLISSCLFLLDCFIQLLLFYWHSNEVTEDSVLVSYGVFESDWYQAENKYQREVALLGITTTKRLAFRVGPFNEMTLKTFVAILRASYSLYTLLNETN